MLNSRHVNMTLPSQARNKRYFSQIRRMKNSSLLYVCESRVWAGVNAAYLRCMALFLFTSTQCMAEGRIIKTRMFALIVICLRIRTRVYVLSLHDRFPAWDFGVQVSFINLRQKDESTNFTIKYILVGQLCQESLKMCGSMN